MKTKLYEQGYAMIEAIFNRDNEAFKVASSQFLSEKSKAILAKMIEGDEMDDEIDVDPDAPRDDEVTDDEITPEDNPDDLEGDEDVDGADLKDRRGSQADNCDDDTDM